MRRIRKITALFLCILMLFPTQSMTPLAETVRAVETSPLETTEEAVEETAATEETETTEMIERIEETLPLEPLRVWNDEAFIYWNPGATLLPTATSSNATPSNAKLGSDSADGKTAQTPVKTLAAALERAEKLKEDADFESSEITIFAMNPMEITDGQLYVLNAANIRIASWPGRTYNSDVIFYVNGGQISIINTLLESGKDNVDPEDAELILVNGGTLQIGQEVEINGRIVMDYQEDKDEADWDLASDSNISTASNTKKSKTDNGETTSFNIDDYVISTDMENTELIEDSSSASTWCDPIIELMESFDGLNEGYILEVRTDDDEDQVELVRTLYADETSAEEFLEYFSLFKGDEEWNLTVVSNEAAIVRDTGAADYALFSGLISSMDAMIETSVSSTMTIKTLAAVRGPSGTEIYWNPGGAIVVGDTTYPEGNDIAYTGLAPQYPLKTWAAAVNAANGGTIICMQSLDLSSGSAGSYITLQGDGSYLVESTSLETRVTLKVWSSQPLPAFIVPSGETLVLRNVVLEGISKEGVATSTQTILCEKGQIIIEENVVAETGYIQINAYDGLKNTPMKVNSINGSGDGTITVFFGGINTNLSYRYVDVVVPGDTLAADITSGAMTADAVGIALLSRVVLDVGNRNAENGGMSKFDWRLRQDTLEDDAILAEQNLELYTDYYFDAIYLNGEIGDDNNFGATCQYPVKTWARARQIWDTQMALSLAARNAAYAAGQTAAYIDEMYPVPDTIYICGTVTVDDTQTWDLLEKTDYDGSTIKTEIVSHTEPGDDDAGTAVHDVPEMLIKVVSGGSLTLLDVYIRNMTDIVDSVTVQVENGGSLTVTDETVMTGERLATNTIAAKTSTKGIHINVTDGGRVVMTAAWDGNITKRQQGVVASGSRATVEMNGGEIRENNAADIDAYTQLTSSSDHRAGAGVSLSNGARFTMNGGKITENTTYQYGGGVYLVGTDTTFTLNRGEVSGNTVMSRYDSAGTSSSYYLFGYGIGIYGDTGTVLNIGTDSSSKADVAVVDNTAYASQGVGIYSNGTLKMNNATVSGNSASSSSSAYRANGIGIYVGTDGLLEMDTVDVTDNLPTAAYARGLGIYLEPSLNSNYIKNSNIKDNGGSTTYTSSSYGGAIFAEGVLTIEGSEISGNKAYFGGAIAHTNSNSSYLVTIRDTKIEQNEAFHGGGIYIYGVHGNLTLGNGVIISQNKSSYGGGIYLTATGSSTTMEAAKVQVRMVATYSDGIQIIGNESSNYGGGIYQQYAAIYADNVLIANNKGTQGGGVYMTQYAWSLYRNTKIDDNTGTYGGGIYVYEWDYTGQYSAIYMEDCEVTNNKATNNGGGFYNCTKLYLSETTPGKFVFSGNHADKNGGGIYQLTNNASTTINIAGDIQNSAGIHGSNLYQYNSSVYILNGNLKQPNVLVAGVYNLYVDVYTTGTLYLDMADVSVEKKSGASPEAVYLNTGNSYLTYLSIPPDATLATFPIDVNTEIFKEGSVVIKPADITAVTYYKPNSGLTGAVTDTKTYTQLKDASGNLDYSRGGDIPRRTSLGPYTTTSNLVNVVIVGEGIYLSSSGDDGNTGLTPEDPVKTFTQAKTNLAAQIQLAIDTPSDTDGFSPFIYICGTVNISGTESWELNYEDTFFTDDNIDYANAELSAGYPAYEAQVRRFASFVSDPLITVQDTGDWTANKIIIDGMADAVIIADQTTKSPMLKVGTSTNSAATAMLTGNAQLRNNYYYGAYVYGSLYLTGNTGDVNKQLSNHHGIHAYLHQYGKLELSGEAKIIIDNTISNKIGSLEVQGIKVSASSNILMKDQSAIYAGTSPLTMSYGVYIDGTNADLKMQDYAKIYNPSTGIYVNKTLADIQLEDFAEIQASTAVELTSSSSGNLWLNMNSGADPDDNAVLSGSLYGIKLSSGRGWDISLGKEAKLDGANKGTSGIWINGNTTSSYAVMAQITLIDDAKITGWTYGVYGYINSTTTAPIYNPVHIVMKDRAAIENNSDHGIYERSYNTSYRNGFQKFSLEMEGDSKIANNGGSGLYLNGYYQLGTVGYRNIIMKDNASIENNTKVGIYADCQIGLTMSGQSKISGNGSNDTVSSVDGNGIYLKRTYTTGTSTITLTDQASICDNRGGIYVSSTTYANYPNDTVITLNGTGSVAPSIQNNTNSVYLGNAGILKLQGNSFVGNTSATTDGRSIEGYGSIELDGRSMVEGRIWLNDGTKPITMTYKVVNPLREYHLWLAESFLSNIVVQPDDPQGIVGGITDVTDQLSYFIKDGADGRAADKNLMALAPNIVLQGENNVYISGGGDDNNSGSSPSTPVRTFDRARELLTNGAFTDGANILVCGKTVTVLAGDEDWSFDAGGYITNTSSGNTWQPLVKRYETFTGILITVTNASNTTTTTYATTISLKDITIDGGSDDGLYTTGSTNSQLLYIYPNRSAILGENAVLQNNRKVRTANYYTYGMAVYIDGGTLEIDGGIIQNMNVDVSYSGARVLSTAIYTKDNTTYPSTITFKSGQIIDNHVTTSTSSIHAYNSSTIYLGKYGIMEMSGGLIENNTIAGTTSCNYGSAIYVDQSTFEMSGGIIRNNEGAKGSALYLSGDATDGSVILSGGLISGNTTSVSGQVSQGLYSPIYVKGYDFQLKGGGCDIPDYIYLSDAQFAFVKVSGNITQQNRVYHLFLNTGSSGSAYFQKGSTVVQPDGSWITDATPYLANFEVHTNTYILDAGQVSRTAGTVSGVVENQCLILMRAVFLDSIDGNDSLDGTTPAKAVKTFSQAKTRGTSGYGDQNYYTIYVSGTAVNTAVDTWTLPEPSYMCRYTGFPVYDTSNNATETADAYYGYMIDANYDLTLEGITIYGRRSIDTTVNIGDSIVKVNSGVTVTARDTGGKNTIFGRNYNIGSYYDSDKGVLDNVSSKGGSIYVDKGGILDMQGGKILETDAAYGKAIYLEADESNQTQIGRLFLSNSPAISGSVYLSGTGSATYTYLEPDQTYIPTSQLEVSIGNDFNGRPVIVYSDGFIPTSTELEYYYFDDAIQALYEIINRSGDEKTVELSMREVIYLDGQNGNDSWTGDTPETAFKTLKQVYQSIGTTSSNDGIVVYIVDTVDITAGSPQQIELSNILIQNLGAGTNYHEGYYLDDTLGAAIPIRGQVYFKRYAQPDGFDASDSDYNGFNKPTLTGSLFRVESGATLLLNGIYIDGHSQESISTYKTLQAKGVQAEAPLVTVVAGGNLTCEMMDKTTVNNGVDTTTLFVNNININNKTNVIGTLNGASITEGSSAGIEILGGNQTGGTVTLRQVEFRNLELGDDVVSGGTDVYNNGNLRFYDRTLFGGTVFLEGLGTLDDTTSHDTSCYIKIVKYGLPALNDFQVLMRDPYMGRVVVYYEPEDAGAGVEIADEEIGTYRLEEWIKNYFCLGKRSGAPWILELQVPVSVYVDGINGDDDLSNPNVGSTPRTPVKTMKRAFELLKTRAGNSIYVVNTVSIDTSVTITGVSYQDSTDTIKLGSTDRVKIIRYIQPDFAVASLTDAVASGYDVADFNGVMLDVKDGVTITISDNVFIDGHSEMKDTVEYMKETKVSHTSEAKAPMIVVKSGATLKLNNGLTLQDNNNTYGTIAGESGVDGGVIYNSGTTTVNGALFTNNKAEKGSAVYQDGTFTIQSNPEYLSGHSVYLTTVNTGTESAPVWGTDHVIQTEVVIPDGLIFDVNMDHAVKGRDVVRFMNTSAYTPDVDSEHEHFKLGSTVPTNLFLVEAKDDPMVLELQNWEILDVEVPSDIYLVFGRKGAYDSTIKLLDVRTGAAGTDLLTVPEYMIKNNGRYDVKVSVRGFENLNDVTGITANGHDKMDLVQNATDALSEKDLYLAVKGLDSGTNGFINGSISLKPYGEATVTASPAEMGILTAGTSGNFTFEGAVGTGFVDKYLDSTFPLVGYTKEAVQEYMDGSTGGTVNARAKYALKYKLEIVPSRR
ncbi:MAG: hypothetical protein ACRDBO_16900 [Lachnospiraceae bacterium]